jgi:hypothetical protein
MWPLIFLAALLGLRVASAQSAQGANVTFSNSVRFMFDTDGNQIDAYAAKINCEMPLHQGR